jgi:Ca-activated chloride channel homolog
MFLMRLTFLFIFAFLAAAQQPESRDAAVFRAGATYVRVDAQVTDGRRPVPDLAREDFRILDEGVEQKIEYFGRESEPLHLVLLLDVSGSMKDRLRQMASAAREALRPLSAQDEVAILLFGRKTRVAQGFTSRFDDAAAAIRESLREASLGAGTAINPAIIEAAKYMKAQVGTKPGRRAIVILTDNEDLNYRATDEATLKALFEADAVLNAIVTPKAKPPATRGGYSNPDFSPADVFKLARESGGEVLRAEKTAETFNEMIERIRLRYSLHYRAPEGAKAGGLRQIQVDLTAPARRRIPKAQVRARSAYAVPN